MVLTLGSRQKKTEEKEELLFLLLLSVSLAFAAWPISLFPLLFWTQLIDSPSQVD